MGLRYRKSETRITGKISIFVFARASIVNVVAARKTLLAVHGGLHEGGGGVYCPRPPGRSCAALLDKLLSSDSYHSRSDQPLSSSSPPMRMPSNPPDSGSVPRQRRAGRFFNLQQVPVWSLAVSMNQVLIV